MSMSHRESTGILYPNSGSPWIVTSGNERGGRAVGNHPTLRHGAEYSSVSVVGKSWTIYEAPQNLPDGLPFVLDSRMELATLYGLFFGPGNQFGLIERWRMMYGRHPIESSRWLSSVVFGGPLHHSRPPDRMVATLLDAYGQKLPSTTPVVIGDKIYEFNRPHPSDKSIKDWVERYAQPDQYKKTDEGLLIIKGLSLAAAVKKYGAGDPTFADMQAEPKPVKARYR